MTQLIDKSAVVAEIKKIEEQNPHIQHGDMLVNRDRSIRCNLLEDLLEFLDTLEVKEVDLEKEIHSWMEDNTCRGYCSASIRDTAEHFFELGLKTKKGE